MMFNDGSPAGYPAEPTERKDDPDAPVIAFLMTTLTHEDTAVADRIQAATILATYAHKWKSRDATMYDLLKQIRDTLRAVASDESNPTPARLLAAQGAL